MKNQKGITLVALIITIVVMIILVTVSVTVALQSGLFSAASGAANDMKHARENEIGISNGQISVDGTDTTIDEYIASLKGETEKQVTATINGLQFKVAKDLTWGEAIPIINQEFMKRRLWRYKL